MKDTVPVKFWLANGPLSSAASCAYEDLKPTWRFVVYFGLARYPISTEIEAIGLKDMAALLAAL
ncbi:MAG: hypothetical protein ACREX4_02715 [Gammaproteobacteria bacterium]